MSKLQEQISSQLKESLKNKDTNKLSTLRMLQSAIKNKQIQLLHELSDDEIISVISAQVKQRKDSIAQYKEGGREDLVEKEQAEIDVLKSYLPQELSQEEVSQIIDQAIKETDAKNPSDMGKVMKAVMPKTAGRADGKVVSELVKSKLLN